MKQGLVIGIVRSIAHFAKERVQEQVETLLDRYKRVPEAASFWVLRRFLTRQGFHLGVVRDAEDWSNTGVLMVCDEPPRGDEYAVTAVSIDMRAELPPLKAGKYLVSPITPTMKCALEAPIEIAITNAVRAIDAIREFERKEGQARGRAAQAAAEAAARSIN